MWEDMLKNKRQTLGDIRAVYEALNDKPRTSTEIAQDMGVSTNTVVQAMRKIMARDYAYPGVRKEIVNITSPGHKYNERIKYAYYIGAPIRKHESILKVRKKKINLSIVRELVDQVLEEYNPTAIRITSFNNRIAPLYTERMKALDWRSRPRNLSAVLGRVLEGKGWVKSQFMESKSDVLLNTPVKVSDFWYTKLR